MCEMQTADQTIMSNISCEFIELYLLYRYIVGNRRIMVGQFSTDYSQRFDLEHLVFFLHHHHDELLVVDFIVAVNISLRHLREEKIRPNFKVVEDAYHVIDFLGRHVLSQRFHHLGQLVFGDVPISVRVERPIIIIIINSIVYNY